jgi:hypothetical protein
MRTEKQKAASRANGARSRGPKSPEGKARSAQNSVRHGLLARAVVLPGESREKFDQLLTLINEDLRPQSAIEHLFVGKMVAAHWRQLRIWELEKSGTALQNDLEMRLDRQFFRTFDRYLRLKAFLSDTNPPTSRQSAISTRPEPGCEPKTPELEPDTLSNEPNSRPEGPR